MWGIFEGVTGGVGICVCVIGMGKREVEVGCVEMMLFRGLRSTIKERKIPVMPDVE